MPSSSRKHPSAVILTLLASLTGVGVALTSPSSLGSGGIGAGNGPNGAPNRVVDERYEYGKAVYLGRLPDAVKISYCLLVDGTAQKLKKKTLKPYRRKTRLALANALYQCDDPSKLALTALPKAQVPFVLYYLNKRYRLKLTDA